MNVEILSTKFIKPSLPTPLSRRNYGISFTDELALPSNVPIILYYSATATDDDIDILSRCHHLEESLSQTLTTYYPFAGRYLKHIRSIDCGDQGVGYVLAKTSTQLHEILAKVKPDVLNDLLPCELGAVDEINDPLLSVQVTMFDCGGLAIAMSFSHRISDMGGFSAFITSWSHIINHNRSDGDQFEMASIFNTPTLFPPRGLPELELRAPRTRTGLENDAKMFQFDGKAISALRAKAGLTYSRFSRVELVFALLYKAMVHAEKAKTGQSSKASHVILPTNLRDKIIPPLPKQAFDNLWGLGTVSLKAGEGDNMEFPGFVKLMKDSMRKFRKECGKILTDGEEGYGVVINPFLKSNEVIADKEVNFYLFTSWCRFPFYQVDFGWGNPVWASSANLPLQNWVTLMDDKDGDGVEAWVYLDHNDMFHLQQDSDLRAFASTIN